MLFFSLSLEAEVAEAEHVLETVTSPGLKALVANYLETLKSAAQHESHFVANNAQSAKKLTWLPKPQNQMKFLEQLTCRHDVLPILLAEPTSHFQPDDLKAFEGNLTGWTEFIDYHPPAAWIINDNAPETNWTLSFPIPALKSLSVGEEVGMKIVYMKTFFNAGLCTISLCGAALWMKLDVLSTSKRHESVQHVYHFKLDASDIKRCNDLDDAARSLSIVYTGNQAKWYPGVGIQYPERHAHKVKIYSASLCYLDRDERRHRRSRRRIR